MMEYPMPTPIDALNLPCDPPIGIVLINGQANETVNQRRREFFTADQAARVPNAQPIDWNKLAVEDRQRRAEVLTYLQAGQVAGAEAWYHAAMILQHGNCPEHYRLTANLAAAAMAHDYQPAYWLYAAATDRYQAAMGEPQTFGTQYYFDQEAQQWRHYECNRQTTDAERATYDVKSLAQLRKRVDELNAIHIN